MARNWRNEARTALAAGLLAVGLAAGPAAAETVLRVVPQSDLKVLDPIASTLGITQSHALMVYDTLFGLDAKQEPQPQMVGDYAISEDAKTYTFTLREGLKFHDGAPVTAEDVVASIKRWGTKDSVGQNIFAVTESLTAEDADTFVWKLTEPYGLLLDALGKTTSRVPVIMPARLAEKSGDEAITEVVGSGPFRFVDAEWVPGSKVVYARNEDYVPRSEPADGAAGGKVVKVDKVEWINISEPQTAASALINGEVDFYETPPADFLPLFAGQPITTKPTNPIGFQGIMRLNHLQPPFDNEKARQAMLWLMDQNVYMQTLFGRSDNWQACPSYFACGTLLETDAGSEALMGQDLDKVKSLMEEAGYDGSPIVVLQPTDVANMNAAALVAAQAMRDAGLNVQLEPLDWASIGARRNNQGTPAEGGWNILFTWWNSVAISNPVTNATLQANCEDAWPGWPCDEELQSMIADFVDATTLEEKKAKAEAIQARAFEVVPYVPFGQWQQPVAYRSDLTGVLTVPGAVVFWNIEKP